MELQNRWRFRRSYVKYIILVAIVSRLILHSFRLDFDFITTTTYDEIPLGDERTNRTTVAFVVTVTGCAADFFVVDGAAVLAYSIHQNSVHGPNGGRYDYDLYAFHHPNASECALPLEKLGYIVEERDTPVAIEDIQNESLQIHIQTWGCCGIKELIKFEGFTLTQYPVVVLLDADTLVLQPLDRLFDFMLDSTKVPEPDDLMYVGKPAMSGMSTNVTIPEKIDLLYTSDYPGVEPDIDLKPTQGGFVVIRPNITVYNDILEIVRKGDYRFDDESGWGGRTGGMFWGDTTFQGLTPYYFQILYSGRALELNYCVWNNNNFPPIHHTSNFPNGTCGTNQPYSYCEDCRLRPLEEIGLVHYTSCYKPWICYIHNSADSLHNAKCAILRRKWFETRLALEESWGLTVNRTGSFHVEESLGYCDGWIQEGYRKLELPPEIPPFVTARQ